MQSYEIILKNEKAKIYKTINWLLLSANLLFIFLLAVSEKFVNAVPLVLAALAVVFLGIMVYLKKMNVQYSFQIPFLFFSIAWFFSGNWIAGTANIVFALLGYASLQKPLVRVAKEKISYPSIFKRSIYWKELSNVVLKDELLTIDFKNNKLIQQLVDGNQCPVDEKEFNDFCKARLNID